MSINNKKYKNVILYLCKKQGGSLYGKKKLAKLLYFIDFDRYEYQESGVSITGDTYLKWKMGPVPKSYGEIINKLVKEDKLEVDQEEYQPGYHPFEVYKCKSDPDMSVFDEEDIKILERVNDIYGRLSGQQLEELSHGEAPFIGTEPNQEIPYDLAYYRETKFDELQPA